MGCIDITPNYEFIGVMEAPPTYQIMEIHDTNMVNMATRMGRGNDRALPPPPREARIQQPLPQSRVKIQTQTPWPPITIQMQLEHQLITTQIKLPLWDLL